MGPKTKKEPNWKVDLETMKNPLTHKSNFLQKSGRVVEYLTPEEVYHIAESDLTPKNCTTCNLVLSVV